MDKAQLIATIKDTVQALDVGRLPHITGVYKGKVRDVCDLGDRLLIFTSDRISAFDRILTTIPCKGEVLNRIALYWFQQTESVMRNHIIKQLSPRSVLVHKCQILPVELVVRGYLTGSAWRDYQKGRAVSGIALPAGMQYNEKFASPLLTPSTKEAAGHDLPISGEEIVARKIVTPALWKEIETKSQALFQKASELAAARGLILVDTKFEFGLLNGELICADEICTPDSSRYWYQDTYRELFAAGSEQRKLDKEYLRQWLMERNFMGDGEAPVIPDDIRAEVALRYIGAYETITGIPFQASTLTPEEEIAMLAAGLKAV